MGGMDHLAVIADIHGNVDALTAVLAEIDRRGIARIVNLGDHASGPLAAAETMALLRTRPMQAIRGNHDRYLTTLDPAAMGASDAHAHAELTEADLALAARAAGHSVRGARNPRLPRHARG